MDSNEDAESAAVTGVRKLPPPTKVTKRLHIESDSEVEEDGKRLKRSEESSSDAESDVIGERSRNGDLHARGSTPSSSIQQHVLSSLPGPQMEVQYQVIHQVDCTRHSNHETVYYEDRPRLFAGDGKLAAIRGRNPIKQDIFGEEYAEDNPDVAFIVIKNYDCGQYHSELNRQKAFKSVPRPIAKALARSRSIPQIHYLEEHGPRAEPVTESIYALAEDLDTEMRDAQILEPQSLEDSDELDLLRAPYLSIYHARLELAQHAHRWSDALKMLVKYIVISRAQEYQEADALFGRGLVTKRHFSKLFAPDDVVVRMTADGPVGYATSGSHEADSTVTQLDSWTWEFDGSFYKKRSVLTVSGPLSKDEVPMASLDAYPLRYGKSGLKDRLRTRGETFWSCRKQRLVECDCINTGSDSRVTCNRFMIDLNTYKQMHPEGVEQHSNEWAGLEDALSPPDDDFLLLLPATVRGYGFHDKQWSKLAVEQLRSVQWSSDTFDSRLVLKSTKKELIKALVTVHTSLSATSHKSDIIEGKGKGLILLLHGGPGTGKTLTAESIAEFAERPLYRVTCGDIGTDPESVEKYLRSVSYIGSIWRCVVLLDEADVFLEERKPTDLKRNALVSVFLRTLEYFDGILVLTSNRVGTFDEAFKSRVQLAMHYPPLEYKDRLEVWHMFFDDMLQQEEKLKQHELKGKLDMLALHDLNGRQIRNVINTARQLARYRKEILAYAHIDQALEVAKEFEEYITRTHGHTDEEFANAEGLR